MLTMLLALSMYALEPVVSLLAKLPQPATSKLRDNRSIIASDNRTKSRVDHMVTYRSKLEFFVALLQYDNLLRESTESNLEQWQDMVRTVKIEPLAPRQAVQKPKEDRFSLGRYH